MSDVIDMSKFKVRDVVDRARKAWESNYSEEKLEALRRADRVEIRINRLKNSGIDRVIPKDIIESVACDKFNETGNTHAVLSWLCNSKPMLFLSGTVGRGKTVAAAVAIAEKPGLYLSAQNAENLFAARYGTLVEQQTFVLERRMLVIDDIGTERDSKSFTATLERIVDSRQGRLYKTMFTSNLPKKQLFERYSDERLISRIKANAVFFADIGEDMRLTES